MFEIFVNGIPRTYRDVESVAIAAGRVLKERDKSAEVRVVCCDTKRWAPISDPYAAVVWKDAPTLKVIRQSA